MQELRTYKLFNANILELKNLLEKFSIKFELKTNSLDSLLVLDCSNLNSNKIDEFNKEFFKEFSKNIYYFEDKNLYEVLIETLKCRDKKISVAESFTGGRISSKITSISGASNVFLEGIVAYSNQAKINRLNVNKKTIDSFYPVSKEVAYEMCLGLLDNSDCDVAISTTGIAGPTSDDSNFPVGLVYIGVGTKDKISVNKFNFKGTREDIALLGTDMAIYLAIKRITNS